MNAVGNRVPGGRVKDQGELLDVAGDAALADLDEHQPRTRAIGRTKMKGGRQVVAKERGGSVLDPKHAGAPDYSAGAEGIVQIASSVAHVHAGAGERQAAQL